MKKNAKLGFFLTFAAVASGLNAGTITNKKVKEIKMKAEAIITKGNPGEEAQLDAIIAPLKGTAYNSLGQSFKKRWKESIQRKLQGQSNRFQIKDLNEQHNRESEAFSRRIESLEKTNRKAKADLAALHANIDPQGQATFDKLKNDLQESEQKVEEFEEEIKRLENKYQALDKQHNEALRKIDTFKIEKEEWALERAALNKQIQK